MPKPAAHGPEHHNAGTIAVCLPSYGPRPVPLRTDANADEPVPGLSLWSIPYSNDGTISPLWRSSPQESAMPRAYFDLHDGNRTTPD